MAGYIFQLNCSDGGVPKRPVPEALLTPTGLIGDRQALLNIHGGPDRALSMYPLEHIHELQSEGHPIQPGSTGENVTIAGIEWMTLGPGTRLALGDEVIVEITGYANPCSKIAASFADGHFRRISQKEHPGHSRLYAKVIQTGVLAPGLPVRVLNGVEESKDGTN